MTRALIERFHRARRDLSRAVLEGFHPLKHALRFDAVIEEACTADPDRLDTLARDLAPDLRERLREQVAVVPSACYAALAPVAPATGVIAIATRPRIDLAALLAGPQAKPIVLLDRPSHLGNVGASVRVAAAAEAAAVLTTGRADPWHPAALRGSAGLHFALPVARIESLRDTGRPVIAFDPGGEPLRPDLLPDDAILAFGAERGGLGGELRAHAARRVAIPMRAGVSSLNLATTIAAALFARRLGGSPRNPHRPP